MISLGLSGFGNNTLAQVLQLTQTVNGVTVMVEGDLFINADHEWTADVKTGASYGNEKLIQSTLLHEFGHMFGLDHPWASQNVWWDSIMNYLPKTYSTPSLHFDDTEGIRQAFSHRIVHLKDAAIFAWKTENNDNSNKPDYFSAQFPSNVKQEESFSISQVTLENLGTETISAPWGINVYLSKERMGNNNAQLIHSEEFLTEVKSFNRTVFSINNIVVPKSVEPGRYYIRLD